MTLQAGGAAGRVCAKNAQRGAVGRHNQVTRRLWGPQEADVCHLTMVPDQLPPDCKLLHILCPLVCEPGILLNPGVPAMVAVHGKICRGPVNKW